MVDRFIGCDKGKGGGSYDRQHLSRRLGFSVETWFLRVRDRLRDMDLSWQDWMSALPEELWDVPLTNLAIPGMSNVCLL